VHLKPLSIYETSDYFRTLAARIAQTTLGDRIALMSMSFDPREPHIATLMRELTAAAQRGADVYVLIDAHAFSVDKHELPIGPTLLRREAATSRHPYFRQKYLVLEALRAHGAHYRIINMPERRLANPYAGRSHIKIAVIGNTVFAGGCNLTRAQIDYMVRLEDGETADWLYRLVKRVAGSGSVGDVLHYTDQTLPLDKHTTLFLDAGKPKQSVIYAEALDLIDSAQDWIVMTCQFFPNTVTAKHLAAAVKRGVHVTLYYNHPGQHALHMRPLQQTVIWAEKTRQPKALFAYQLPKELQRLHAKVIASELGAMIGSHNYVTHGVNFGTAEIAIRRLEPAFAHEALTLLREHLPPDYTVSLPAATDTTA
jgi:phosphatidylserine/phosphatidylglycerophosphate/cardiolipin synthase-like enzyme